MFDRRDDANHATFTDTVFGFFGVPAATGRKKAVAKSDHAVEASQCVINDANELQEALAQLAGTLGAGDK